MNPQPPQRPASVARVVIAVVVVLGLTFGLAGGVYFWVEQRKQASGPLDYPALGSCTDTVTHHMGDPVNPVNCADPRATVKIVKSQNPDDPGDEVTCTDDQILYQVYGKHYGEHVFLTACGTPQLTVGRCYHVLLNKGEYRPACGSDSARLVQILPRATSTDVCGTPIMDETTAYMSNFVDETEEKTYCFEAP
ncbi:MULTISPECIES: hypothetical protein [Nocardia]|uniref:hypothetical protein n=1 Tax=Nocardia TaxID=1817 RepID=UPI00189303EE|nr:MULTISPECIES: hypothetical protein [Nocardia]MBF6351573.1 hypothetical protein [Nocardia flavorosea]